MRIFKFCLIFVNIFLFLSCSNNKEKEKLICLFIERDYDAIIEYQIEWNSLFSIAKDHYFVYVYSNTCLYCKDMKNEIISYRIDHDCPIYFVTYSNAIPIFAMVDFTIGKTEIEGVGILGTPSLITIDNKTVSSNVAGRENIINEIMFECNC